MKVYLGLPGFCRVCHYRPCVCHAALPPERLKPFLLVPDRLVGLFKEKYPHAEIIPLSETMLPCSPGERDS